MPRIAIIVLGAPNDEEGVLSSMAVERCEQALREYEKRPGAKIIPTGGWGIHFNTTDKPHGQYLAKYLKNHGVPPTDILEVPESTNTIEDAKLSRPIVLRHGFDQLVIVTSDFHLARAKFLFERHFAEMTMEFCGSPTNLSEEELESKRAHEEKALARLRPTWPILESKSGA